MTPDRQRVLCSNVQMSFCQQRGASEGSGARRRPGQRSRVSAAWWMLWGPGCKMGGGGAGETCVLVGNREVQSNRARREGAGQTLWGSSGPCTLALSLCPAHALCSHPSLCTLGTPQSPKNPSLRGMNMGPFCPPFATPTSSLNLMLCTEEMGRVAETKQEMSKVEWGPLW